MALKASGSPGRAGMVADAMGKNRLGNARVNVPEDYAMAEWSIEAPPSASALKLLLLIIAASGDDLDGEKRFPMSLLREVPGLAHKDAPFLEAELMQLMKATVRTGAQLNHLMGNMYRTSFGVIISDAAIIRAGKDGPLEGFAVRFGETFKAMVRFGEHFAVLDSVAVMAMRSRHSVLLYQWLAFALRAKIMRSLDMPLADVRRVFGLMGDEYPMFGLLKQRVLTPACAEISALTEYRVTATPILEGRKAVGVRFSWQAKAADKLSGSPPSSSSSGAGGEKAAAKVRKPSASARGGQSATASQEAVLQSLADRLNTGRYVSPSEVSTAKAAALLSARLVAPDVLRARGIAY